MTAPVSIDVPTFTARLNRLRSLWQNEKNGNEEPLVGCDALVIALGEPSELTVYQKSTALFSWLLGYEFPETVMAIGKECVYFLTSHRKAQILKQLVDEVGENKIKVFGRDKEAGKSSSVFQEFWNAITGGIMVGPKIGYLSKDRLEGPMYSEWAEFFGSITEKELVDVAPSISSLLVQKDSDEQEFVEMAAQTSSVLMENYVASKVLSIIDDGKKNVSHSQLSEMIDSHINDQLGRYKNKLPSKIQTDQVDICYPPIIQSGGIYSLKPSAISNEETLYHSGAIMASIGIRYHSYCSNISRTLLVNPTKKQEVELVFLFELEKHIIGLLKPGTPLQSVYDGAVKFVKQNQPELERNLPNNRSPQFCVQG